MIRTLMTSAAVVFGLVYHGQAQEATSDESSSAEQSVEAEAAPQDVDVASLIEKVGNSASGLQGTVANLQEAMNRVSDPKEGAEALDAMLAAARDLNESLNSDSEIWTELNTLLQGWTDKRNSLNQRCKDNAELCDLADRWQERIDTAQRLRSSILDQAAQSASLVEEIENKREVILEYYELDLVDEVLAQMSVMNDELTAMNQSMQDIVSMAGGMAPGTATTTN